MVISRALNKIILCPMQSFIDVESSGTVSNRKRRKKSSMKFSMMDSSDTDESDSEQTTAAIPKHSESIISLSDNLDSSVSQSKDQTLLLSENSDDIVLLSDTESNTSLEIIEEDNCVDLTESKNLDGDDDDSVILMSVRSRDSIQPVMDHFKLDAVPDFIPMGPYISNINNRKYAKRKERTLVQPYHKARSRPLKFQGIAPVAYEPKFLNTLPSAPNGVTTFPIPSIIQPVETNGTREKYQKKNRTRLIQLSYPNILNDNSEDTRKSGLRPIIIDGCNVGFGYGNGEFVMRGPILVIQYFKNRGHDEIVCFLPNWYRHRTRSPSEERTVSNLEKENMFSYTPSRSLTNGKKYIPYDDRYILQYATERQGVIISNDGYRDLINEEASWKETIEKRIVNYTFARDILMLPKDPFGPEGPTLDEILKFPLE